MTDIDIMWTNTRIGKLIYIQKIQTKKPYIPFTVSEVNIKYMQTKNKKIARIDHKDY